MKITGDSNILLEFHRQIRSVRLGLGVPVCVKGLGSGQSRSHYPGMSGVSVGGRGMNSSETYL